MEPIKESLMVAEGKTGKSWERGTMVKRKVTFPSYRRKQSSSRKRHLRGDVSPLNASLLPPLLNKCL